MPSDLKTLIGELRKRMSMRLDRGEPIGETGRLVADAEEELERHTRTVGDLLRRAEDLDRTAPARKARHSFFDRPRPDGLDRRAARPKAKDLKPDQVARGVVFAYETANPTFYRSVIERLQPGEKVRNVTSNHAWYEYTRDEFEMHLPGIASSPSYQTGTDAAPGKARYVTGRPPAGIVHLHAPDWKQGS